jgi:hypothetical protein
MPWALLHGPQQQCVAWQAAAAGLCWQLQGTGTETRYANQHVLLVVLSIVALVCSEMFWGGFFDRSHPEVCMSYQQIGGLADIYMPWWRVQMLPKKGCAATQMHDSGTP